MAAGKWFLERVAGVAQAANAQGLRQFSNEAINKIDSGASFGSAILGTGRDRLINNAEILNKIGKKAENVDNWDIARSMLYNKQGQLQKGRVAGAIAGGYMAANMVGHGSLGIPLISNASWNR